MYLQLHDAYESDGYVVSYPGVPNPAAVQYLKPYDPFSHTGNVATKYFDRYPQLGQPGLCFVADGNVRKAYVLDNKNAWKDAIDGTKKTMDLFKKFSDPAIVGSRVVTNPDGSKSSVPVTKSERIQQITLLLLDILISLKGSLTAAAALRLQGTAAEIYDSNKYNLVNLCTMSVPQLKIYANKAYNDISYWSESVQTPGKSAGDKRIANRNIVCSVRALELLVGQLAILGVSFAPNAGSAAQETGTFLPLAVVGILASLMRF
jgi:hypothetical protein